MKKEKVFAGTATALITPMKRGAIHYAALDGLITPALLLAATFEEVSVTATKKDRRSWTTVVSQANGNRRSVTFIDATPSHFEGQFRGCSGSWRILS